MLNASELILTLISFRDDINVLAPEFKASSIKKTIIYEDCKKWLMHFDQYFVQSNVCEMSRFVSSVCLSSLLMASESLLYMQVAV